MIIHEHCCKQCGNMQAKYDNINKIFICTVCETKNSCVPVTEICEFCKVTYFRFTHFDPSYCKLCGKNLID